MHSKGSPIHRIVPGLCIQGGDFVCRDGSGGESIYGASFAAEGFVTMHTEPGLLCMANAGPDTNRSKFYILRTISRRPRLLTLMGIMSSSGRCSRGWRPLRRLRRCRWMTRTRARGAHP
jgi:cyclophilin family peptidyl-prolyl cis-trans isomerase